MFEAWPRVGRAYRRPRRGWNASGRCARVRVAGGGAVRPVDERAARELSIAVESATLEDEDESKSSSTSTSAARAALDRRRERDPGGRGRVKVEQNVVSRRVFTTGRVRSRADRSSPPVLRHARAGRPAAGNPGVCGAGGADQTVGGRVEEQARELLAEPQRREGREGVAHDDEKLLVELRGSDSPAATTTARRARSRRGRATATVTGARRGAARGAWRAEMREKAFVEVEDGK